MSDIAKARFIFQSTDGDVMSGDEFLKTLDSLTVNQPILDSNDNPVKKTRKEKKRIKKEQKKLKGLGASALGADEYYVDINPSEISESIFTMFDTLNGVGNARPGLKSLRKSSRRMRFNLIFDLVEEYDSFGSRVKATHKSRKINGTKIFSKSTYGGLIQDYSKNQDAAINILDHELYSKIVESQVQKKQYVIFVWGDLNISGYIEHFTPQFTYFSRSGVPLRVESSISIIEADPPKAEDESLLGDAGDSNVSTPLEETVEHRVESVDNTVQEASSTTQGNGESLVDKFDQYAEDYDNGEYDW